MAATRDRVPHFLAVVGPTASGKSELGMALARELDGEIISADSRQIYRAMDVGTAKATARERTEVPHHGLDLREPGERYSAGQFGRNARRWVEEIRGRGRVPLVVGGTGFFVGALLNPIFREPAMNGRAREALRRRLMEWPRSRLEEAVSRLDPERLQVAKQGGPARLVRTLEVAFLTGRPLSWWHRHAPAEAPGMEALVVRLRWESSALNARIEARAREMWAGGLLDEVEQLLAAGFGPGDPGFSGQGYAEAAAVLRGEMSAEEGLERMIIRTRQYARRQETWLRHQLPDGVLELSGELPLEERMDRTTDTWIERGGWVGPGGRIHFPLREKP